MTTRIVSVGKLLAQAKGLIAEGLLSQAEAEGAMLAALNHLAPDNAQAVASRQTAQMSPQDRLRVQEVAGELRLARRARMTRARAALLEISDEDWQAMGGALDE